MAVGLMFMLMHMLRCRTLNMDIDVYICLDLCGGRMVEVGNEIDIYIEVFNLDVVNFPP